MQEKLVFECLFSDVVNLTICCVLGLYGYEALMEAVVVEKLSYICIRQNIV